MHLSFLKNISYILNKNQWFENWKQIIFFLKYLII